MEQYDHTAIEKKWQKKWPVSYPDTGKPKKYILDMFPYPSGAGLHVGHVEGYTATDIYSRYMRMKGFDVLHPMGWDSFGLPAENYAIKTGVKPAITTHEAIKTFTSQMKHMGFSYDWSREIAAHDPHYYRWTQWLFTFLYKKGLAYRAKAPVNWCPSCQTVLANEQVVDGKCERCDSTVVQRDMEQWFFKITAYCERLLADLDKIDWPESTKQGQRNWIGKSEGAEITFSSKSLSEQIIVYTTKPETVLGVTYIALAPEHPMVSVFTTPQKKEEVNEYVKRSREKTALERTVGKKKSGVHTGSYVLHPMTKEAIPVWVSDYVLMSYGTGAVMGVPDLDDRDNAFAKEMNIPVRDTDIVAGKKAYENLVTQGLAISKTRYKLRDWLVSRQRYWGAPIPMVLCEEHGWQSVPESALPIKLPEDVGFKPTGESPIRDSLTFQHSAVCPVCHKKAQREVDTMDTFVDSSWYFLRFTDPHNEKEFASSKALKRWMPVDLYVGGAEHTVLHLLYSRFITKVLYDSKLIDFDEPFMKLRHQGIILASDHRKMSKRWGNIINPDDEIQRFGADTVRMYEMFMGPLKDMKAWNTNGERGVYRFLNRVWQAAEKIKSVENKEQEVVINKLAHLITNDIERLEFNTCISSFMETLNELTRFDSIAQTVWDTYLTLLAPFAPYITEELWSRKHADSVHLQTWPTLTDIEQVHVAEVPVIVQNKVRATITLGLMDNEQKAVDSAISHPKIAPYVKGKKIDRVIYVPGKVLKLLTK